MGIRTIEVAETYEDFVRFLDIRKFPVLPLREYRTEKRPAIGLRHDVDKRMDIAFDMALYEADLGLRATYFIKHTSPYWKDPDTWMMLREMEGKGHEIGLHNDILSVLYEKSEVMKPEHILQKIMLKFDKEGLDVVGTSAHGAWQAREARFLNWYVWEEIPMSDTHERYDTMPTIDGTDRDIEKLKLKDWFEYEANFIKGKPGYYSDADGSFDFEELDNRIISFNHVQVNIHPNKRRGEKFLWVREF